MKYLSKYKLIKENIVEKHFQLSSNLLQKLKQQNPIIDDIYDTMLEVMHESCEIVPIYTLIVDNYRIYMHTEESWNHFDLNQSDFDDLGEEYKDYIELLNIIRNNKHKDIYLEAEYQFANPKNGFSPLELTDRIKSLINNVIEKLINMECEIKCQSGEGKFDILPITSVDDYNSVYKFDIKIPITLEIENKLSLLDNIPNHILHDYSGFIKDYNIDTNGQSRLANIIRDVSKY